VGKIGTGTGPEEQGAYPDCACVGERNVERGRRKKTGGGKATGDQMRGNKEKVSTRD